MKNLLLIRGLPGSGKTTFANTLHDYAVVSADDWMPYPHFDSKLLGYCHKMCFDTVKALMLTNGDIAVANTFTTEKELQPYIDLAKRYDYTLTVIVMENYHGNSSVHNVPAETIDKMKKRFTIKL